MKRWFPLLGLIAILSAPSFAGTVQQKSDDVQALQAWVNLQYVELDQSHCNAPIPNGQNFINVDCSQYAPVQGPSAAPWILQLRKGFSDNNKAWSPYGGGNTVEIRVVVKKSVLNSSTFTGIGFYARNMVYSGNFTTPKDKLQIVSTQDVTLASSGEKAVILRFVLWFPGEAGDSGTGWGMDSVQFKPYAEFKDNGTTYINWDLNPSNYVIHRLPSAGGEQQVASFDRQNEILKR